MGEGISESIEIAAPPAMVFRYFVQNDLMIQWMGERAALDARPGGGLSIEIDGVKILGTFVELDAPHRVVFRWGFEGSDSLPPNSSEVEVRFTPTELGTLVELRHTGLRGRDEAEHRRGWPHFLGCLRDRLEAQFPQQRNVRTSISMAAGGEPPIFGL